MRRATRVVQLVVVLLLLSLAGAQASGVTPTSEWMDIYSANASFAGAPLPVGSYVAAFDPQGVQCGEHTTTTVGKISPMMPCYGDENVTPQDEGAVEGDLLTFSVNGTAATVTAVQLNFKPVAGTTPIKWHSRDAWEVKLVVPPQPVLTIAAAPGANELTWPPAPANAASYEVWRGPIPYFNPGADQTQLLGSLPATEPSLAWSDGVGAGDPAINVAYRVVARRADAAMVGVSQTVAEFDYALLAR